ncbi:MAG: 2'-5' RNA ligase family protein [Minisyncoccia bacterium]
MNKQQKPRVGIYGSAPKDSEVFNKITSILGYDPFRVKEVEQDQMIAPVCGRAKSFGAHFTIYDIFTPTDLEKLINRVRQISADIEPFDFTFSKFAGHVRGDYQGKSVYNDKSKTVLGLDFDNKSVEKFNQIHKKIVTGIQDLREKIEPEFDKEIFRNVPELRQLIQTYGAPYVLENYEPHLTLASKLDGSNATLEKLINYLNDNYGNEILNKEIPFGRIYIFQEILGGKFDGYFKAVDEIFLAE